MIFSTPQILGYGQEYARHRGDSASPALWHDHVWVPSLGRTGDDLLDLAGRGQHGTINGATWAADDPRGLSFDGTDDDAALGAVGAFDLPEATVLMRVAWPNGWDSWGRQLSSEDATNDGGWVIHTMGTTGQIRFGVMLSWGMTDIALSPSIFDGRYHTVGLTYSESAHLLQAVVDGQVAGSTSPAGSDHWLSCQEKLYVARRSDDVGGGWNARIDVQAVGVWARVLDGGELADVAADFFAPLRQRRRVTVFGSTSPIPTRAAIIGGEVAA